jgi:FMN reductase
VSGRPLVVGLGGTPRPGSSTERALALALRSAEARGARTRLIAGGFLERLPHFSPGLVDPSAEQLELVEAVGAADGIILATPGYHGSLSGLLKNALDTLELGRSRSRPYFDGKAVGVIITADGGRATGTTLMAVRAIIHALRGWPTPFGAALNANGLFDEAGSCRDPKDAWQLSKGAGQVMEFAQGRPGS